MLGLRKLQSTQASIAINRNLVFSEKVDPLEFMVLLSNEIKYVYAFISFSISRSHVSYQRRLALFYLFNDVVQFAAKDHLVAFLEHGCSVFIPAVSKIVERLSDSERAPFLRTLSVWDERRVFSVHFVDRLRSTWSMKEPETKEIVSSISLQRHCSDQLVHELLSILPKKVNGFISVESLIPKIEDTHTVRALAISLSTELNDLVAILVKR